MSTASDLHLPQALFSAPRRQSDARRWDGLEQRTSAWDGLRRDPDLWFPDGDCVVYLYRQGTSKRGPSFLVPYYAVKAAGCVPWLFDGSDTYPSGRWSPSSSVDEGFGFENSPVSLAGKKEMFIGSCGVTRQEVFDWHITTRNFFAWLLGKPLVGQRLSQSLENLLERLQLYRGHAIDNLQGVLDYAKDLGYMNFADCPDHALAMLSFAEKHRIQSLYIEAFAHCVGMSDRLSPNVEYPHISRLSKALISRAYLEMDLHIGRASQSVGSFLEEELSPAHIGLTKPVREHLEEFRSFLQSYSIAKYGYWPPSTDAQQSKPLYQSMDYEFRSLYDFLADKTSSRASTVQQPVTGGICVLQNVELFNERHKYQALPYALPLVPLLPALDALTQAQRVRRSLGWGSKDGQNRKPEVVREALVDATNRGDMETISTPLLNAYVQFELEHAGDCEDQVSIADARRVRWILVYAIVQMLSSLTHAPPEVRNSTAAPYPLCCLTIGLPPWGSDTVGSRTSRNSSPLSPVSEASAPSTPPTPPMSIHPDCENNDYFNYLPGSRPASTIIETSRNSLSRSLSLRLRRSTSKPRVPRPEAPILMRVRTQIASRASNDSRKSSGTWSSDSSPIRSASSMSSESLVLTMPALCWSSDSEDKAEGSSSDDEIFSPALEQSGFFSKSFDPYYSDLPGLSSGKEQEELPSAIADIEVSPTMKMSFGTFLRYSNPEQMHHSLRI